MRGALYIAVCALLFLGACEEDDATGVYDTIVGTWDLIGYSDHGIAGVTTGAASFGGDNAFSLQGTVTYPSEPTDTLDETGTYTQYVIGVTITTDEGTGTWVTTFSGDEVVLKLVGTDPPTVMTLKRQAP